MNSKCIPVITSLALAVSQLTILAAANAQASTGVLQVAGVTLVTPTTRDPLKWPFAHDSIWNRPIGANARYVAAKLPAVPRDNTWAGMPQIDEEIIVMTPTAPTTPVRLSTVGWTGGNRCLADDMSKAPIMYVPMPANMLIPNGRGNNSAVFLASDKRTLIHTQPFSRCTTGGYATSWATFTTVDLYADGRQGSHGATKLSAIGGSLRLGELRPGTQPPRHALKVNVDARVVLYPCKVKTDCYRWPALSADSYAVGTYGSLGTNVPSAMRMGALLALPSSVDINKIGLESMPGMMLAWTLQNYGAYIVDDTTGANFALNAEISPDGSKRDEFKRDWGYDLQATVRDNTPWSRDMQRIVPLLAVVDSNAEILPATSTTNAFAASAAAVVGAGGGTPRQPMAPVLTAPK